MDVESLIDDLNLIADECGGAGWHKVDLDYALQKIRNFCLERIKEYDIEKAAGGALKSKEIAECQRK